MKNQDLGALPRKPRPLHKLLCTASLVGALGMPLFARGSSDVEGMSAEEVRALLASFDQVMTCGTECGEECITAGKCTSACVDTHKSRKHIGLTLQKVPAAWKAVGPAIAEKFQAKETTCAVKGRMLDFLAESGMREAVELSCKLFECEPAVFQADHLISFASMGSEVFGKAVADAFPKEKAESKRVLLAAWLAGKGDAAGKQVLEDAVAKPCAGEGGVARSFVAAKSLENLGTKVCMDGLSQKARENALAALDAGDVATARRIALEVEFGRKNVSGSYPYLPYFDQRLHWTVGFGAHEYPDAEKVFALVEEIGVN